MAGCELFAAVLEIIKLDCIVWVGRVVPAVALT
jgi:hypothetical protein